MVKDNHAQLENKLCRAAYALVLNKNKEMRVKDICDMIHENFSGRLKYVQPDSLARLLTICESSGMFRIITMRNARAYALTPKFYNNLASIIELETAGILAMHGRPYSTDAGVMLLYHRQLHYTLLPTMYSVFNLARDALADTS